MSKYLLLILICVGFVFNTKAQTKKYITYTVKKGETLRSIAKDFDVKPKELYDLNPDIDKKPNENTVILIPIEVEERVKMETLSYTVAPKETLYTIAKGYNTTVEELIKLNPSLESGLKEGQTILIPKTNVTVSPEEKKEENLTGDTLHKVEKGDTLYNLSKRYQTTEEELIKLNPLLKDGLKLGQELVLPNAKVNRVKYKPVSNMEEITSKEIIYTVEKGDTFYGLTKRFQISEESLLMLNPNLKNGLKEGMELRIIADKTKEVSNSKSGYKAVENPAFKKGKSVNVVLMMPFKLNEIDDVKTHFDNNTSLLNITSEFYQGALVAIDSLRNQGALINLKSFDSETSDEKLLSILKSNNLSNTDVYIGPLFLSSAYKLAKNISNGYVVAPMNSKEHNKYHESNLVKSGVSSTVLEDRILQFMKRNYTGQNVIVVGDNKPGTANEADRIAWKLKSNSSISAVSILKPVNGYITKDRFLSVLSNNRQNWILLVGDDNIVITDAVNTYGIADKSTDIRLFSLSNEGNIEKANNNYLAKLQYTYPSAEYINANDVNVQHFMKSYKDKFYASPSNMAIRGFDVTYDSLYRILLNGNNTSSIDNYKFERVGARFDYKPTSINGFENTGIYILKIEPDLSLTVLEN